MSDYPNKRDCEHGRQRGKCDSCECDELRARAEAAEALLRGVRKYLGSRGIMPSQNRWWRNRIDAALDAKGGECE